MENVKNSFKPIVDRKSKILILGSLPSDKSIMANEYYGNKTNQFWDIISLIFEKEKINFKNYDEKIQFLKKHNIALWDVYCSAERFGSLDTNIKNGTFNSIKEFMNTYKNIELILVNGKKAEAGFRKYLKSENVHYNYRYVPSSSSANTRFSVMGKVELWRKAIFE